MNLFLSRGVAVSFVLTATLFLSACAKQTGDTIVDPMENMNRKTHALNKALDKALLRPAGNAYGAIISEPDHEVINNFAANLSEPSTIVNQILQGRIMRATKSSFRFVINTTLGFGGTVDAGKDFGLFADETDFGETLDVWGFGEGAYVELPFFAGSTVRDTVGLVVDFAIDPMSHVTPKKYKPAKTGVKLLELAGDRDQYGDVIDGVLYDTEDSYASQRLYYLQNRRFKLNGGEISEDELENPYETE
jgi:phospholipid-binding lipoprotein MlaA